MSVRLDNQDKKIDQLTDLIIKNCVPQKVGYTDAEVIDTLLSEEKMIYYANSGLSDSTIIADTGCPATMNDRTKIESYLKQNNLDVKNLSTCKVQMVFKFGESKYICRKVIDLPIKLKVIVSKPDGRQGRGGRTDRPDREGHGGRLLRCQTLLPLSM